MCDVLPSTVTQRRNFASFTHKTAFRFASLIFILLFLNISFWRKSADTRKISTLINTSEQSKVMSLTIDYERMGRDMELNSDVYTIETSFEEVHVFRSRWKIMNSRQVRHVNNRHLWKW